MSMMSPRASIRYRRLPGDVGGLTLDPLDILPTPRATQGSRVGVNAGKTSGMAAGSSLVQHLAGTAADVEH
jgi:hypothetical protein